MLSGPFGLVGSGPAPGEQLIEFVDRVADDEPSEIARNALAQIGIAHGDARDGFPENERLDTATGDFDFGQLWHEELGPCLPYQIYLN